MPLVGRQPWALPPFLAFQIELVLTPLHPIAPLQSYVPIPVPQYLSSEWSFAQFRVPPPAATQHQLQQQLAGGGGAGGAQQHAAGGGQQHPGRIVVGFSPAELHTLIMVTQAGSYHKVAFDPVKGGAMAQVACCSFISWPQADGGDGGDVGGEAVLV